MESLRHLNGENSHVKLVEILYQKCLVTPKAPLFTLGVYVLS